MATLGGHPFISCGKDKGGVTPTNKVFLRGPSVNIFKQLYKSIEIFSRYFKIDINKNPTKNH
jgi:hypothetical protein